MVSIELFLNSGPSLILTHKYQHELGRIWDNVNSDPLSFATRERKKKGVVSIEEIIRENGQEGIGGFAVRIVRQVCERSTQSDIIRRLGSEKKFMAVGYGQGWDAGCLPDVTKAGLQTCWVEVGPGTCLKARQDMACAWKSIDKSDMVVICPPPQVVQGEIRSVLVDPSSVGLNLDSVEMVYMCRTLFALSLLSAKIVLQIVGHLLSDDKDPDKYKVLILIVPLEDDNPCREVEKSIKMTRNQILYNIRLGARRRITVEEQYHRYFERLYTAMIIRAE